MSLLRRLERGDSAKESADRRVRGPSAAERAREYEWYPDLKIRVQNKLLAELDTGLDPHAPEVRTTIEELFTTILAEESVVLGRADRQRLFEAIVAEILGFGPLEPLLADNSISLIMVNGPKNVYVKRRNNLIRSNVTFDDDEHVLRVMDRMFAPLGITLNDANPVCAGLLPDGSSVSVVLRPFCLNGPLVTIRKVPRQPLNVEDLIRFGTLTPEIAEFARATVIAKLNILVCGRQGAGKTALLNMLSMFIPNDERIITLERNLELQLRQEHVVPLATPTIDDALASFAAHQRTDRLIFDLTDHTAAAAFIMGALRVSSMAALSATTMEQALVRCEIALLRAYPYLPLAQARSVIAQAIDMIVVIDQLRDGSRKVTQIAEVVDSGPTRYQLNLLFTFEQTGIEGGKVIGRIRPTGIRPTFEARIRDAGIYMPPSVYG
ncbi:MAG: CpaF family protein, partial [Anaerolineae bacterium]|nr:CpaF family protein [Anaerolineae bacterium]